MKPEFKIEINQFPTELWETMQIAKNIKGFVIGILKTRSSKIQKSFQIQGFWNKFQMENSNEIQRFSQDHLWNPAKNGERVKSQNKNGRSDALFLYFSPPCVRGL